MEKCEKCGYDCEKYPCKTCMQIQEDNYYNRYWVIVNKTHTKVWVLFDGRKAGDNDHLQEKFSSKKDAEKYAKKLAYDKKMKYISK